MRCKPDWVATVSFCSHITWKKKLIIVKKVYRFSGFVVCKIVELFPPLLSHRSYLSSVSLAEIYFPRRYLSTSKSVSCLIPSSWECLIKEHASLNLGQSFGEWQFVVCEETQYLVCRQRAWRKACSLFLVSVQYRKCLKGWLARIALILWLRCFGAKQIFFY